MSIAGQMREIAQEIADGAKDEALKALAALEVRLEALEAKLGGTPDETESAAKAPRRGRKPVDTPASETVAEAAPAVADAGA